MYQRAEMALVGVGVVLLGTVLLSQPAHPLIMRPVAVPSLRRRWSDGKAKEQKLHLRNGCVSGP